MKQMFTNETSDCSSEEVSYHFKLPKLKRLPLYENSNLRKCDFRDKVLIRRLRALPVPPQ